MTGDGSVVVGIFDSGVGGLSVWREVVRQMPQANTLYLADQAHVPYGSRSLEEVRGFAEGIARYLLACNAKAVVVACNSASAAALHYLRRSFPEVPFVGMEPAVKPATERTRSGVVGVIATEATFQGELFASLVERHAGSARVIPRACPGLVGAVEAGRLDSDGTRELLQRCLEPLLAAGMDQLVLGCTHYAFVEPAIRRLVGPKVGIIDPAAAVARQTARVLAGCGVVETEAGAGASEKAARHVFCTTGDTSAFADMAMRLLDRPAEGICVKGVRWHEGRLISRPAACAGCSG
jgi:glutamate racemase